MSGCELFVYFINSYNHQLYKGPAQFKSIIDNLTESLNNIGNLTLHDTDDGKYTILIIVDRSPCESLLSKDQLFQFIKQLSANYKNTTVQLPRLYCKIL